MITRQATAEKITAPLFGYADHTPMQDPLTVQLAANKASEVNAANLSPHIVGLRYLTPPMTVTRMNKLISNNAVIGP